METEKLLAAVIDKGLVRGFIDRSTNEFVIPKAIGQSLFVGTCPHCGGSVQRQFLIGETPVCPYCRSVIAPSAPPPPPMPPPPSFAGRPRQADGAAPDASGRGRTRRDPQPTRQLAYG